jgi:tetratricopeptide (TPR) repeat protein
MKGRSLYFVVLIVLSSAIESHCQETVFALLKNDLVLANEYFENENYGKALELYSIIARKSPSREIDLKIARSYHFLKQYSLAISVYEKHLPSLVADDLFYFAEAQSGISNYEKAIESYQHYLSNTPDDPFIIKKIWRLNNVQFLFEDSAHYAVRPLTVNSQFGELCAVPYKNGIVFLSNRKGVNPVEKLNASRHTPLYKMYFSKVKQDTTNYDSVYFETPSNFNKAKYTGFQAGPLDFYNGEKKMVFTSTAGKKAKGAPQTLKLYFAEYTNNDWKVTSTFPYNSEQYSVSDPAISDDGKVLFFSSDMKGGYGGKDLYKSELINNQWTKPANLGEIINTPYDEVFPFVHNGTLYFSSNGQAGLGGLDIFKMELAPNSDEPQNLGYPLNSSFDDFGIVFDSLNNHGYFSSNRSNGGFNDDLYEFDMDLQTYPITISGSVKYKEHSWSDSLDLKIISNAKISLIDNIRNLTIKETTCDADGNFTIEIPYYSKYKIKVAGEDNDENFVSLELPKHKRSNHEYEIVIVKDAFKLNTN